MKKLLAALAVVSLATAACGGGSSSDSGSEELQELNVGYFQEWPTPNQIGQEDGSFAEAVGIETVNWQPFSSGNEMSEAMEAGSIDISYSQGLTPFANTVNNGADLRLVGIAVSYGEGDNCVAQSDLGVTQDNAAEVLKGATVMTPIGNVTHYKMLSMMEYLGVDLDDLTVVPAEGGPTTAAAFDANQVEVACAFGGSLVAMLDGGGSLIMPADDLESELGIATYDIVSIPTSFGEEHPDAVTAFLKATDEFNEKWEADPEANNPTIAQAAGMENVDNFLSGPTWFTFPSIDEQLSDEWLGGDVAENMSGQLQTFVDVGEIDSALDDFSTFIDTSYLEAAQ